MSVINPGRALASCVGLPEWLAKHRPDLMVGGRLPSRTPADMTLVSCWFPSPDKTVIIRGYGINVDAAVSDAIDVQRAQYPLPDADMIRRDVSVPTLDEPVIAHPQTPEPGLTDVPVVLPTMDDIMPKTDDPVVFDGGFTE
jgi:hypothetical protein